uniref:Protein kinase domain-containing protein n=1 Tax=Rhizophora mucronata TaxID=61149 RepID=A0A2P2JRZ1_RHIMU
MVPVFFIPDSTPYLGYADRLNILTFYVHQLHDRPPFFARKIAQWVNLGQRMLLQAPNSPSSHKSSSSKTHHRHSEPSSSPPIFPPIQSPLSPSFSSSPSPSISDSPSFSPAESLTSHPPSPSTTLAPAPSSAAPANPPVIGFPMAPASVPAQTADNGSETKHHIVLIAGVVGGSVLILLSAIGFIFFRSNKVVTVRPWATGLSGQLQKAFVTGVPKLKRSELEVACEDFSNIIGFFLGGTVYKGTLSSGVEIAVTSAAVKSHEDWSKNLETQFRKKIDILSKVNHKNFVNLIGYCEEDEPFTRMMVFEYAPNGTLFEHLHVKEAEHLDWGMRVRIAMGMAYCLDHLHQLAPPMIHENLQSSSICLTEDYAAKISDFSFWNDATAPKTDSASMGLLEALSASPATDTYSFGVILFEMLTGRMPCIVDNGSLADWVSSCLRGEQPLRKIVDPTLETFVEDELEKLLEVVKICIHPDPNERPTMREIAVKLKEITSMGPDGALPKLSPLWWAELEIMSAEGS